jgi:glycosyltransferase involved in cell wall biosynthesis
LGWDILLKSFFEEFDENENVKLYILTSPYHHDGRSFPEIIQDFINFIFKKNISMNNVILLKNDLPNDKMPMLYKSVDCFVLPSRGEGWGRPHVEASNSI